MFQQDFRTNRVGFATERQTSGDPVRHSALFPLDFYFSKGAQLTKTGFNALLVAAGESDQIANPNPRVGRDQFKQVTALGDLGRFRRFLG